MRIEIRDAFGTNIAEGELTVHNSPGVDEHTPSTLDEINTHLRGQRIALKIPSVPEHMAWSILVYE
jgi:hypothetical protein